MKAVQWILVVAGALLAVFLVGAALITPTYKVERSTEAGLSKLKSLAEKS